jgi:hypothetical protein
VFNAFSIVTVEALEVSDVFTVLTLRPIHYHTSLMLLGVSAIPVNVQAAKINFLTNRGTFSTFGLEIMFC